MAFEPLVEAQPGPVEDLRIQPTTVVDDDADRRAAAQCRFRAREHGRDPGNVLLDRRLARTPSRCPELALTTVIEPEQLIGVAVLLVVVDQPWIGGEVTTPSYGPPTASSRVSPWRTTAARRGSRTSAKAAIREAVSAR